MEDTHTQMRRNKFMSLLKPQQNTKKKARKKKKRAKNVTRLTENNTKCKTFPISNYYKYKQIKLPNRKTQIDWVD